MSSRPPRTRRVDEQQRQVEDDLHRRFGHRVAADHPVQLDRAVADDTVDRRFRFVSRYKLAKAARRAEREPKKFELVRRGSRALFEQFEAALAHRRVFFVGEKFEPVGEGADGAQEIVTQARGQHRGEIDAIVGHG
jgi:hypothetical protein